MFYQKNPFTENKAALEKKPTHITFEKSAQYIFLEELKKDLEEELGEEEILGTFPLTNEKNSAVLSTGYLGMNYVRKPKAKEYAALFKSLRGNRLLMFTTKQVIFLTVIEYLEEGLYYTYPYEKIENVHLMAYRIGMFNMRSTEPKVLEMAKNGGNTFYLLDIFADGHYIEEIFSPKEATELLDCFKDIPQLKEKVNRKPGIYRKRKWDRIFANPILALRFGQWSNILWFVLLGIVLILFILGLLNMGPWQYLHDLNR